jgi:hypothetical protein
MRRALIVLKHSVIWTKQLLRYFPSVCWSKVVKFVAIISSHTINLSKLSIAELDSSLFACFMHQTPTSDVWFVRFVFSLRVACCFTKTYRYRSHQSISNIFYFYIHSETIHLFQLISASKTLSLFSDIPFR